jgi:ribosomal protein S27AE
MLSVYQLQKSESILKNRIMYKTGEKPGKGRYRCSKCGEVIYLNDATDVLPPCPKCHNTTWTRV